VSPGLPLFPLGSVLFPGLVLPLHIFEPRYRLLVRDLLSLPEEDRRFGVIAIRQGREVGADGVHALYDVGCIAHLRRAERYDDGRFDIVRTGTARFRLDDLDDTGAYLRADVELLPDEMGPAPEAPLLDGAVRAAFVDYLAALSGASGESIELPDLPDSPMVLGFLVAATTALDLEERQRLLEADDGCSRLRAELSLLRRESTLLRHLSAAPAPELARTPVSPN
jgi:Lon protease-like protein